MLAPHGRERFLLIAAYIHPLAACRSDSMEACCTAIEAAMSVHSQLPVLVVGDFNARHSSWHDDRNGGNNNAGDTTLATAIDDMDLHVHNAPGVYTRVCRTEGGISRSIIDLVLSRPDTLVYGATQRHRDSFHLQDHIPFTIDLTLNDRAAPAAPPPSRPRTKWDAQNEPLVWQRALPAAMRQHIAPLQPLLDNLGPARDGGTEDPLDTLEAVYRQVEAAILAACTETVGTKQTGHRRAQEVPWWTRQAARLHREFQAANRRLAHTGDSPQQRQQANADKGEARRRWRAAVQRGKRQAREEMATLVMDPDSRLRYSTLRRYQRSPFTPLTGIKDGAGGMPASHEQSLDNLCAAFIRDSTPLPLADPPDLPNHSPAARPHDSRRPHVDNPPATHRRLTGDLSATHQRAASQPHSSDGWTFTAEQVAAQTRRRTCKTSAGPDSVLPLFLRYGGEALYTALASVFNYSWRHSVTPQAWREANVTALYKGKGECSDPKAYRPISVTSGIARTFEHLIHERLADAIGQQLARAQFGFRARRSTTDAILQLLSPIQYLCGHNSTSAKGKRKEAGASTAQYRKLRSAALFLDIQKAFDRVDHSILLDRLSAKGVHGAAWRWIRSFLTDRRMRCVDNQYESHWQPVRHGVPQGCVLSPLLFLVFIDELIGTIRRDGACSMISPIFYADDGVLGPDLAACRQRLKKYIGKPRGIVTFEQQYSEHLKVAAAHLDRWCKTSRMHFGEAKTKVVVFNRGKHCDDTHFDDIRLCGYIVGVANSYDYLGLTLSHKLKWDKHVERKLTTAREVARRLTSIAYNARPVEPAVIRELVRTCLVPSFDYGIEYWGIGLPDASARPLQAAMAKPLRVASGLPLTTHQLSTLRGAGVSPVATHTQHKQLQHLQRVSRLLHDDAEHPTAQLYTQLQSYDTDRRHMLDATVTSPVPVYLVHAVLPFAMDEDDDRAAELALPTRQSERRTEAHTRAPKTAGRGAARAEPHGRRHKDGWAMLKAMHRSPLLAAQDGDPDDHKTHLRATCDKAAHLEWTDSHEAAPPAQAAAAVPPAAKNRTTTAPLTSCLYDPDGSGSPPLRFLHPRYARHIRHKRLVCRMRLLYGRSYTATVRARFPTDTAAAAASTLCPHTACTAAGTEETIEHMLLHCPHYTTPRAALAAALNTHNLPPTLRSLLNPPTLTNKRHTLELYEQTDAFLSAITRIRRDNQLPALDGCPHYSVTAPPAPPAGTAGHRRRVRRAAGPAAPAAPLPLDTG